MAENTSTTPVTTDVKRHQRVDAHEELHIHTSFEASTKLLENEKPKHAPDAQQTAGQAEQEET
jgi:hypothetical protein